MRYFTCLVVALCISASLLFAADQPKISPAEQEVINASQARREAANRRDVAAAAGYISDDCLFSDDDGNLMTKARWIEGLKKMPFEYDHITSSREFVVRLHGDTAILNLRVTGHEQFGDADIVSEQRRTETWMKQNGSWLLIAVQWGNIPVNFRKPVAFDAKVFADYVGEYPWRPGMTDVVTVKDGKLWSKLGEDVAEYLPAGNDSFFIREGDLGTISFVRDAQGRVTGYTYHRVDGQEIHAKRTK
jgi:ketosteroid isomerase-like protein